MLKFLKKAASALSAFVTSALLWMNVMPAYAATKIEVFGEEMNGANATQAAEELANKAIGLINMIAGFVGVILFGVLVYAGFKVMTTGDNPQENARAKSILLYAIGGAALVFFAWLLAKAVVGKLSAGTA